MCVLRYCVVRQSVSSTHSDNMHYILCWKVILLQKTVFMYLGFFPTEGKLGWENESLGDWGLGEGRGTPRVDRFFL